MSDDRLPKQLFYSELSEGHRLRGRPMLRFKDTLKKSLQNCRIATAHWETTASNRRVWKQLTRKGAAVYEQAKRRVHKKEAAKSTVCLTGIPCRFLCYLLLLIKLGFMAAYSVINFYVRIRPQLYGFVHCFLCCGFYPLF